MVYSQMFILRVVAAIPLTGEDVCGPKAERSRTHLPLDMRWLGMYQHQQMVPETM